MDIAEVRRKAKQKAEALGGRSARAYRTATAVSEFARNLFFHAGAGGIIRIVTVREHRRIGVEVVPIDTGPGIADIDLAMQDGYSATGGLGGGLPGTKRLMDKFSIESQVGVGTLITARM